MEFDILSRSPLFRGMDTAGIAFLLNSVNYQVKRFSKGDVIALREDPCNQMMIVLQGSIKGEMLDFSGKVIRIEDVGAPRPIAAAFLFGRHNRLPVDIIANDDVQLLMIPRVSVIKLLQSNRIFLQNYLDAISNRAQFLSDKLYFLSFKTIRGKLAQYILNLAKPEKNRIVLPGTQLEMAEFFGVTRPAFARVLGELEREGIILVTRREITIHDRRKLIELIR